jgi:tetrahydromethanopterin S-methyltransferase subunit G
MTNEMGPAGREDLRETAEEARRIAGDAAHDAELERPAAAGAGGHPHPQIRHADHLRAEDDVRTYARQASAAEGQARAAEILGETAERLEEMEERLEATRAEVRDNREDVRTIERDTEALGEQVDDAADAVREVRPPDVR